MKLPSLLAKNSLDVQNVHKFDCLVPYFTVFVNYKFFSDCCGGWKGDASFVLLRFILFVNKGVTLFICENCMHCNWFWRQCTILINQCNSSNIKKFFLAPHYYRVSLLRTQNRSRGCPQQRELTLYRLFPILQLSHTNSPQVSMP